MILFFSCFPSTVTAEMHLLLPKNSLKEDRIRANNDTVHTSVLAIDHRQYQRKHGKSHHRKAAVARQKAHNYAPYQLFCKIS